MPTTYRALIYAAVNNAMAGVLPEQSPAKDAESIAETLFPAVSQAVCERAATNEYLRSLLRREKSLTLVAGEDTLDDDVLTHYIADATLINPSNLNTKYAWRDYPDFVRRGDKRLGVFSLQGTTLMVIEPNTNFTVPLTATGPRMLTVPCVVVKPDDPDDDVDGPEEIISDLMEGLSEALKGQISKTAGENV